VRVGPSRTALESTDHGTSVVIEPGHRLTQRHALEAGKPERTGIGGTAQAAKAAAQMESEGDAMRLQPAPPAPHGVVAQAEHRSGAATRR
jgi:hypothetical protein